MRISNFPIPIRILFSMELEVTYQISESKYDIYFGIDGEGKLAEIGYFLATSFRYVVTPAIW